MTVQDFRDLLIATGIKVCHFDSDVKADPYIVFSETREGDEYAGDDEKIQQTIMVNVYYVTPYEYDDGVNRIQGVMTASCIPYRLNGIEWVRDIKRVQYTWTVTLLVYPEAVYGDSED